MLDSQPLLGALLVILFVLDWGVSDALYRVDSVQA